MFISTNSNKQQIIQIILKSLEKCVCENSTIEKQIPTEQYGFKSIILLYFEPKNKSFRYDILW